MSQGKVAENGTPVDLFSSFLAFTPPFGLTFAFIVSAWEFQFEDS